MIGCVRGFIVRNTLPIFIPTWDEVESVMTYELFGGQDTYCNTPSEIICMIGLIASVALALINFSLVYTGPTLMNVCIIGSTLLGFYACRRMRRLIACQHALEEGISKRDEIAQQMMPASQAVNENSAKLVDRLSQCDTSMTEKLNLLSQEVDRLIQEARNNQNLEERVEELNCTIQAWIKLAQAVEISNQQVIERFEKEGEEARERTRLPDNTLNNIIPQLRRLMPVLDGEAKKAVSSIGLKLINSKKTNEDQAALVNWVVETLKAEVLPKVQGDTHTKCQEIIEGLEAL